MSDPYMLVQFDDGGFLLSGVNPRSNALSSRVMDVRSALMSTGAPSNLVVSRSVFFETKIFWVREVFVIHVGGTRCVTFSTDNNMKIHGRITLTVEFIRGCILIFLFYV